MSFTFSSTAGTSGITTISVSATSREELTALVENYTLSNTGKTLLMPVTQEAYEPLEKYIIFQPTGMTWSASGDTGSLNIQSNDDWTIVSNGWIQLSRYEEANRGQVERPNTLSGNGNTIVGLRCSENTGETRTGGITGYCKSNSAISATTVIEQTGSYVIPHLRLSSTGCSIGSSSASTSVTVTSNISWDVISDARWITLNTLSGTGNGTISFEVSGNVDSISRKGVITVFNATYDIYAEFAVEQAGEKQYIVISPYSFQVPSTGSSGNVISISANCDYDITTDVNWITLSAASGSGNGSVSFTTGENTSKYGETGNIIFSNSAVSSYATVERENVKPYLSASTSIIKTGLNSGSTYVDVYSNTSWDIRADYGDLRDWFTVQPNSGEGNERINITIESGDTAKTGTLMIYNNQYGLSYEVKIKQINTDYDCYTVYYTSTDNQPVSPTTIITPGNLTSGWTSGSPSAFYATFISEYYDDYGLLTFSKCVSGVGPNAFKNNTTLESIILNSNISVIRDGAFLGCTNLKSVNSFNDSVFYLTTVPTTQSFLGCTKLKTLILASNVGSIGDSAFRNCSNLDTIYVYKDGQFLVGGTYNPFSGVKSRGVVHHKPNQTWVSYWKSNLLPNWTFIDDL